MILVTGRLKAPQAVHVKEMVDKETGEVTHDAFDRWEARVEYVGGYVPMRCPSTMESDDFKDELNAFIGQEVTVEGVYPAFNSLVYVPGSIRAGTRKLPEVKAGS